MKIHSSLEKTNKPLTLTMGSFDGVHQGHQFVIEQLKMKAEEISGQTGVIIFEPHPRIILGKVQNPFLIQSLEEKKAALENAGVHHLYIIPFDKEVANFTASQFLDSILTKIKPKVFLMGYDHLFGKNREGDFHLTQKLCALHNIECQQLKASCNENPVSSTKIRASLSGGDVKKAALLMGRPYSIAGIITKGKQLGQTIGFPTANIEIRDHFKILPKIGSYAVWVEINAKKFKGMLNIGSNPTVGGAQQTIEVNIFDFNQDIYGENIYVYFMDKIRNEVKFPTIEVLKAQLHEDKKIALNLLANSCFIF